MSLLGTRPSPPAWLGPGERSPCPLPPPTPRQSRLAEDGQRRQRQMSVDNVYRAREISEASSRRAFLVKQGDL